MKNYSKHVSPLDYKISLQISIAFCLSEIREYKEKESQQKYILSNNILKYVLFLFEKNDKHN